MSGHKDPQNLEIESLSDDDLESVSGGSTTSGGTCESGAGGCTTTGGICQSSGGGCSTSGGTCKDVPVSQLEPSQG